MQKSRKCRIFLCLLICSICTLLFGNQVKADWEKVYFGSEEYEWQYEETSLVGVYASSNQHIDLVEMYVKYDARMLEYESGGELVEEGLVKIEADGVDADEYKVMLEFTPIIAGNTQLSIVDSNVTTVDGEEIAPEEATVPIRIPMSEGCQLEGIRINGEVLNDFEEGETIYRLEVASDVENIEIQTFPEEIKTEVSGTTLVAGENEITIETTNEDGEKALYILQIIRAEVEEAMTEYEEAQVQQGATMLMEREKDNSLENQILIGIIIAMLVVIFAMLIVIKVQIARRNRRRRERELRRKRARQGQKAEKDSREQKMKSAEEVMVQKEEPVKKQESRKALKPVKVKNVEDIDKNLEISVQNVTMEFKRQKDESTSIKEHMIRVLKKQVSYEKFKALDDVSFDIRKGEVVGIIGTNGSGKSTILKIISGVLEPTKGRVLVDKKKIQLLTLGTGFDFELTGRENVYLNGAIIGYTKEFIDEKYDEIVKFAELEGFMEEKVRNYSSGMVSRLGFAIATIRNTPEILILDEVLSVGDMFFRQKSEARIKEMMHGGSTVLIVSHSPSVIRSNCTKAVWIEKGKLMAFGDPKEVCDAYEKMGKEKK